MESSNRDYGLAKVQLSPKECKMVRSELQAIVCSQYFRSSKRYPTFLSYVVEKTLKGEARELKERTIGVDVFGRPPDYDTNSDPIVRNTACEVRRRISLYHAEASTDRHVDILLPPGSYHPEIRFVASASQLTEVSSNTKAPVSIDEAPLKRLPPSVERESQRRGSRRVLWVASVLLLLLGGGFWWGMLNFQKSPADRLWIGFLNPAETVLIVVPQAPSLVTSHLDGKVLSNWIKDNPDIAAEDIFAITRVVSSLVEHHIPYRLQIDSSTTLADIRDRPIILIGGPSNAWTTKLLTPLRFHFSTTSPLHVEDSNNLASQQWAYTVSSDDPRAVVADYAIIARYRDPTTGGMVMVLAGVGRNGTEAAGELTESKTLLNDLNRQLPPGWKNRNLEVVLKTSVIDGKTGSPSIVATHLW
jgi:hypothetical protein